LLTATLVALVIGAPALAQLGGLGFGGPNLLSNKGVQDEIKLTDKQKAEIKKVQETFNADMKKAREDKDREAFQAAFKKYNTALGKVKDGLKPEQVKRLNQIEIQASGLAAFKRKDVLKELKLSDKQKDQVKDIEQDLAKDMKELFADARGDREKMTAAIKKLGKMRTDAFAKVVKTFDADQKKAWKELTGKPYTIKFEGIGGSR
jgi:Spy/CpxP family protein refolding chaperone